MGFFDRLWRGAPPAASAAPRPQADAAFFSGLTDPRLIEFMRDGPVSTSGALVNIHSAFCNTAVLRCVSLISSAIGMLPLHLIDAETKQKADSHPLFPILHREPNDWQTAFDFRTLMQMRALVKGNAYALVVRSPINEAVLRLVPLDPDAVKPIQNADWTVSYRYTPGKGAAVTYKSEDIFHLRGLSIDGISGVSLVSQARDAIGLALAADLALGRMFRNGSFVEGVLVSKGKLSDEAFVRLRDSWAQRYSGAENAGKTPLLEDGVEYEPINLTARDAQSNETRSQQVEEIARVFGVPRPLLMVDDTSWGTGIDVLGQFFVLYALAPWFEAWQQAVKRTLLVGAEKDRLDVKFNAGALERGNMAAQGDFFAKALGAGGQQGFLTPNEVRDLIDMPSHDNGDALSVPAARTPGAVPPT